MGGVALATFFMFRNFEEGIPKRFENILHWFNREAVWFVGKEVVVLFLLSWK